MTVAVKNVSLKDKLKELEDRVAQKPMTHIDGNTGAAHIVFTPSEDNAPKQPDLKEVLQIVRDNFSQYAQKAAHHPIKPEDVARLSTYLDIALKDFENNVKRFMPNIKNTDYKLEISVGERNKTAVRIGFKNPQGQQIGPFLSTNIISSPQDMLTVNIGYVDKHKEKIYTHSFGYDSLKDVDGYVEKRGDKTYLKTREQIISDKTVKTTMKQTRDRLLRKRDGWSI